MDERRGDLVAARHDPGSRAARPAAGTAELVLTGAPAGPLAVELFDLQGRRVHRQGARADGSGQDTIQLDLTAAGARIGSGIYFARVVDSAGGVSPAVKLVVIR